MPEGKRGYMEVEFDVKISPSVLYDYLMYHTYHSLSGLLGTIVGAMLIVAFFMNMKVILLIAGIVVIVYLPWTLFLKSRQQYLNNESFKKPIHYRMAEEGIEISQGDSSQLLEWEKVYKAVSSSGSILLYTSKYNACMLPKKELGDKK